MTFDPNEVERIIFARLVLLGIQPSEIPQLSEQEKWDVLAIAEAQAALAHDKLPGQK